MADTTKRRKIVSTSYDASGSRVFSIYNAPDDAGVQTVAETITPTPALVNPALVESFIVEGILSRFANIYNRLEVPTAPQVRAEWDRYIATVTDGTWTPGRATSDDEPDDIAYALAEVTGQPVAVIVAKLDAMLAEPKRDAAGNALTDKKGRAMHVWSRPKLYAAMENSDPRVKQALSKIIAAKARRLADEAKASKGTSGQSLADMFGTPEPTAAAAQ